MIRIDLTPKRYFKSQDLVCFMTAYHVDFKVKKFTFPFFRKEPDYQALLKKYHISTLAASGFVITPEFIEKYTFSYDPVWQNATMDFVNRKGADVEEQKRYLDRVSSVFYLNFSAERLLSNDLIKFLNP